MRRLVVVLALLSAAAPALAQTTVDPPLQGPPPPVPPAVINRDAQGRVTIRATRVTNFHLDGRLDEAFYQSVPSFGDFVQQEPHQGEPASDKTEVWVFFDDNNLYVAARLWEQDPSKRVATEMRRDASDIYDDDHFGLSFDTFYDRRNGYGFAVNSLGGLLDWSINNEKPNNSWNGLWDARTATFDHGWTLEIRFPFRSFRYREGGHVWGINFRRMVRADNELSYLVPVQSSWGRLAMSKMSIAATLVGLDVRTRQHNVDAKFYGLSSLATDHVAVPSYTNKPKVNGGLDLTWGARETLITQLTVNTDFAQVEDDQQQVNLTRFSLFYPEKRDFFLEGADTFSFGGGGGSTPLLFYSRQIGLANGVPVPIRAGGRVLGRAGPWNFGALNIETGESTDANVPRTNFSVGRLTYDFLARSRVGVMFTSRSNTSATHIGQTSGASEAYGADLTLNPSPNTSIIAYLARSQSPVTKGSDLSYRGSFNWSADRYGLSAQYLVVDPNFKPEVGLVRRWDFRDSSGSARFSPRPGWRGVRHINFNGSVDYLTDTRNVPESKEIDASAGLDFQNSDSFSVGVTRSYERLDAPFSLGGGVALPPGDYTFAQQTASYVLGQQHRIAGTISFAHGNYYDGTLTSLGWTGRVALSSQLYAEPTISWNRVRVLEGDADTNLVSSRITYTFTPHMFTSALIQYQSRTHTVTTNARFRWEYILGSELFVVYSDGRSTLGTGPGLQNRSFIVKVTRLLRW
jgi:Domain of unknown function (DUF5916)/Carbohydrate family 9 binding domain-like